MAETKSDKVMNEALRALVSLQEKVRNIILREQK